jgi:hypothetical protein
MQHIDTIDNLQKIWQIDLSKLFTFAQIDYNSLHKQLYNRTKTIIRQYGGGRKNMQMIPDLLRRKVDNWVGINVHPALYSEDRYCVRHSYMEQIDALKATNSKYNKNKYQKMICDNIDYSKCLKLVNKGLFDFIAGAFRRKGTI